MGGEICNRESQTSQTKQYKVVKNSYKILKKEEQYTSIVIVILKQSCFHTGNICHSLTDELISV